MRKLSFKDMLFNLVMVGFVSIFMTGCSDMLDLNPEYSLHSNPGKIQFSFNLNDSQIQPHSKTLKTLSDPIPKYIVLTLTDETGTVIPEYKSMEIELLKFGDSYVTELIELEPGIYQITEYLVLDTERAALYVAPVAGSLGSQLVNAPLPKTISITETNISAVLIDVVSILGGTPEDFGYASLGFNYISTLSFKLGVTVFNSENRQWQFVNADLMIRSGGGVDPVKVHYENTVDTPANIQIQKDGDSYSITVEKEGYVTANAVYTEEELENYKNTVLVIQLEELGTQDTQQTQDEDSLDPTSSTDPEVTPDPEPSPEPAADPTPTPQPVSVNEEPLHVDGSWLKLGSNYPWGKRSAHESVVFLDRLYVIGGNNEGAAKNDVCYTVDGLTWTQVTRSAPFTARMGHTLTVFNNRLYLIGGWSSATQHKNDVWYTDDGETWIQATASAPFPVRAYHQTVVLGDRMYVLGGYGAGVTLSDVWYTEDGTNWSAATMTAPWSLSGHSAVALNDRIYIIGGYYTRARNEVWSSTDGVTWTLVNENPEWSSRYYHKTIVYRGRMYITGGRSYADQGLTDCWSSYDGITWTQVESTVPFDGRYSHSAVTYMDVILLLGGRSTGFNQLNDFWGFPDL